MLSAAYRTNFQTALAATVVAIKTTGGKLFGVSASNGGTVSAWLQFFDVTAADVTIGTTAPKFSIPIVKGASATDVAALSDMWPDGVDFQNAISVAATTDADGSTGTSVALDANFFYR